LKIVINKLFDGKISHQKETLKSLSILVGKIVRKEIKKIFNKSK
jgi:hypothetical protein